MRIEIGYDDKRALDLLDRLKAATRDLRPAMRDIGEAMLNSTKARFDDQEAPDGTPWAELKDSTKARKKRNADKILTERGDLRRDIVYRAGTDQVEIGTPRVYGGTHQFGAEKGSFDSDRGIPWGDIPARPFLGVSPDDADTIVDILSDHLRRALERGG